MGIEPTGISLEGCVPTIGETPASFYSTQTGMLDLETKPSG